MIMLWCGSHDYYRLKCQQMQTRMLNAVVLYVKVPAAEATASQRNFLGWPGFRKPSLLSITSLISPSNSHTSVSGTGGTNGGNSRRIGVCNRGPRSGRTFSLDDLFRLPKRKFIFHFITFFAQLR